MQLLFTEIVILHASIHYADHAEKSGLLPQCYNRFARVATG